MSTTTSSTLPLITLTSLDCPCGGFLNVILLEYFWRIRTDCLEQNLLFQLFFDQIYFG